MTPSNAPSLCSGTTQGANAAEIDCGARQRIAWVSRRDFRQVVGMGKSRPLHHASERISRLRANSRCEEFPERRGSALVRNRVKPLAVIGHEGAEGRLAKRMCLLEHRLKHRSEVAGRGIDDLQDLRSSGLLLQGLARLVEQAGILD